jgi:hypothetical protein
MNIPKLALMLLQALYIYFQAAFLFDFARIHRNMAAMFHEGEFLSFAHSVLHVTLSPGGLIGAAAILIIFSNKFNWMSPVGQWLIVVIMFALFFINIVLSFMFAGPFFLGWLGWQFALAFFLACLLIKVARQGEVDKV